MPYPAMKDFLALLAHLLITIARLLVPGGAKAIVADSLLMKQQLLITNRSRKRAPSLKATDRLLFGFFSLFLNARSIQRAAVIIRPSTLLKLHNALKQRKYRLLFSSANKGRPGSKGPTQELIDAIVQVKKRNPRYGCLRIAEQINNCPSRKLENYSFMRLFAHSGGAVLPLPGTGQSSLPPETVSPLASAYPCLTTDAFAIDDNRKNNRSVFASDDAHLVQQRDLVNPVEWFQSFAPHRHFAKGSLEL